MYAPIRVMQQMNELSLDTTSFDKFNLNIKR